MCFEYGPHGSDFQVILCPQIGQYSGFQSFPKNIPIGFTSILKKNRTYFETWYCELCVCSVFPYNDIENDDEFPNTIAKQLWYSDSAEINFTHFSDKAFNPLILTTAIS